MLVRHLIRLDPESGCSRQHQEGAKCKSQSQEINYKLVHRALLKIHCQFEFVDNGGRLLPRWRTVHMSP